MSRVQSWNSFFVIKVTTSLSPRTSFENTSSDNRSNQQRRLKNNCEMDKVMSILIVLIVFAGLLIVFFTLHCYLKKETMKKEEKRRELLQGTCNSIRWTPVRDGGL